MRAVCLQPGLAEDGICTGHVGMLSIKLWHMLANMNE